MTLRSLQRRLNKLEPGNSFKDPTISQIWLVGFASEGEESSRTLLWENPQCTVAEHKVAAEE